ncbi:MAG: HD-GYP domain-containing protein [Gemmatimonadales bacterium]|nr:MAG: HD-GYP domain-containing protein [Gemmatimonadales bacterium]
MNEAGSEVRLQEEGRRILVALYASLRAIRFYPLENEAVQKALSELHDVVSELLAREEEMVFRVVGDFFFLNGSRLRLDLRNFSTFGAVASAFRRHGVGEVEVVPGVRKEEWLAFLPMLHREVAADEDPYPLLRERMEGTRIQHISIEPEKDQPPPDLEDEDLDGARRTYAYSVGMAKDVLSDIRIGRAVNVRKVKRAVQSIVDQVLSDEPSMLAMTHLREFDEYTFTHSVNVCIFSVVIGQRLGLDRRDLYELGLGALFHDVGKMRIPEEVLNKEGALNEEEWRQMQQHPTEGLLALFEMEGFTDLPYRPMLLAYEHHMKVDLKGYPRSRRPREIGLFSRIVSVADAFDAGTSVRSYQYRPWPPDAVLREMRENPKRGFDPLVVKAFITATGIYPVGTLVVLDTFELAVVTKANSDPERLHQPHVKIIADGMGTSLARPLPARLDETDPSTGELLRTIIKTADPNRYGVDVAAYVA